MNANNIQIDPPVKIVDDKLICLKWNHNEPVILAVMEEVSFQDKFLCAKCLENITYVPSMTPLNQAIQMIKEKKDRQKLESNFQTSLNSLEKFQIKIRDLQSKLFSHFNESLRITQQWIDELKSIDKPINLIEEFKNYKKNEFNEQIARNNKSYSVKLNGIFDKIIDQSDFLACFNTLKEITVSSELIQKQQPIRNIPNTQEKQQKKFSFVSEVKFIDCKKQEEWSKAMAFNETGTIIVAGCNKDIKVWNFNQGKMSELQKLTGHTANVNCIVYSKIRNWFVSGSEDSTIICWKEQKSNQWITNQPIKKHSNEIMGLLLNNKEDEMISCSYDKAILIWKVDCERNQIDYNYSLENKHSNQVLSISLNQIETLLVSCSLDKSIVLWSKDKNKKWIYQNTILNSDYGYRISFINNFEIAWQQCHKGVTHIFQVDKGVITRKPGSSIELSNLTNDQQLFPTIVNQQKQIIIQRYNKDVFIFPWLSIGVLNV